MLAHVIQGQLIISIPVSALQWAVQISDYGTYHEYSEGHHLKILNSFEFAKDVVRELNMEAEDGSTLVTRMLDKAMIKAIENGSEHIE